MSRRRGLYALLIVVLVLMGFSLWFYTTQIMPQSSQRMTDILTQQAIEYGN